MSGRVVPDADELIALIHAVNPTGQDVTKRERERRYATTFSRQHRVLDVACHPSGSGFLVSADSGDEDEPAIEVFATDVRGNVRSRASVPGDGERVSALAAARGSGAYLQYCERGTGTNRLARLAGQAGELVVRGETSPGPGCQLLQDEAGTVAVALSRTVRGVELASLVEELPGFVEPAVEHIEIPSLAWPPYCRLNGDASLDETLNRQLVTEFHALPEQDRVAWAGEQGARLVAAPARLLCLRNFLLDVDLVASADDVLRVAETHHPDDLYVRLAGIEHAAKAGRFTGGALLAESTDAKVREHLIHMQGLVLLTANQPGSAIEVWAAIPDDSRCRIGPVMALAKALMAAQSGTCSEADETPDLAGLVRAALAADAHLARGDLESARRTLDRAWIRNARELQTLARLAEVYLAMPLEAHGRSFFQGASLLAELADAGQHDLRFARQLWLGERTWDRDRLRSLVTRARAWLAQARPNRE